MQLSLPVLWFSIAVAISHARSHHNNRRFKRGGAEDDWSTPLDVEPATGESTLYDDSTPPEEDSSGPYGPGGLTQESTLYDDSTPEGEDSSVVMYDSSSSDVYIDSDSSIESNYADLPDQPQQQQNLDPKQAKKAQKARKKASKRATKNAKKALKGKYKIDAKALSNNPLPGGNIPNNLAPANIGFQG